MSRWRRNQAQTPKIKVYFYFYKVISYKLSKDQNNKVQLISGGHQDIWHQVSQSDLTNMKETLLWLADMMKFNWSFFESLYIYCCYIIIKKQTF